MASSPPTTVELSSPKTKAQVIAWILLSASFTAVLIRLLTRFYLTRRREWDDLLLAVSFVFSLGFSITQVVPDSTPWGAMTSDISPQQLATGLKTLYAAELLALPTILVSRLSICYSVLNITPIKWQRRTIAYAILLSLFCAVVAEFCYAFQCHLAKPWDFIDNTCIDLRSIHFFAGITDIFIETCLVMLTFTLIVPLQMPFGKKLAALSVFCTRMLFVASLVLELVFLPDSFGAAALQSGFGYIVCMQVAVAMTIITACVLQVQPFFASLQTGMLFTTNAGRTGFSTVSQDASGTGGRRGYMELSGPLSLKSDVELQRVQSSASALQK